MLASASIPFFLVYDTRCYNRSLVLALRAVHGESDDPWRVTAAGAAMNLDLHEIQETRQRVRRTVSSASLGSEDGDEYEVTGEVTLDLDVRKDESTVRLVGRLDAMLDLGCSRCLERFDWPVSVNIDMLYVPESEDVGDGDVRIEEADVSTAFYRDEQIDLGQLMREQFQLTLPMKPLCREDCFGLCAVCGGNRNTTTCQCTNTWEDPRLAGLKNLLNR